ncbi:MAG: hypothetical protein ACOWW1_07490 [archaeon]|nr:hypothetical protein [Candidatus Bathyarchaeum sp.]
MNSQKNLVHTLGVTTCLIGAVLMAFGEPILGLIHTGVATVIGILGLCLITAGNKRSNKSHKEACM